jgi:hypothetical protein
MTLQSLWLIHNVIPVCWANVECNSPNAESTGNDIFLMLSEDRMIEIDCIWSIVKKNVVKNYSNSLLIYGTNHLSFPHTTYVSKCQQATTKLLIMVVPVNPNCSAACHLVPEYVCGGNSVTRVNSIYLYMFHIPCKKLRGEGGTNLPLVCRLFHNFPPSSWKVIYVWWCESKRSKARPRKELRISIWRCVCFCWRVLMYCICDSMQNYI